MVQNQASAMEVDAGFFLTDKSLEVSKNGLEMLSIYGSYMVYLWIIYG